MNKIRSLKNTINTVISNTFFFPKRLQDIYGLVPPKYSNRIVSGSGSERLVSYFTGAYVHEVESGHRPKSTKFFFSHDVPYLVNTGKIDVPSCDYLWIYEPTPWVDDFELHPKNIFGNNYYQYLRLHNKLIQARILEVYGNTLVQDTIRNRSSRFKTTYDYFHPEKASKMIRCSENGIVIAQAFSDGGSGVFHVNSSEEIESIINPINRVLFRYEHYIHGLVSINQTAVILPESVAVFIAGGVVVCDRDGRLSFMGIDYNHSCLPKDLDTEKLSLITRGIAECLRETGFLGIFGCDYLFDPESYEIYLSEINARYQSSNFLMGIGHAKTSIEDIEYLYNPHILHMLAFLGEDLGKEVKQHFSTEICVNPFLFEDDYKIIADVPDNIHKKGNIAPPNDCILEVCPNGVTCSPDSIRSVLWSKHSIFEVDSVVPKGDAEYGNKFSSEIRNSIFNY